MPVNNKNKKWPVMDRFSLYEHKIKFRVNCYFVVLIGTASDIKLKVYC